MKFYDESASILSAFDIEGLFLLRQKPFAQLKSLEDDMQQLMKDQKTIERDYKRACDKILED